MPAVCAPDDYLVVMTACVDPSRGRARVARLDPRVRLDDYLAGLRFWLDLPDRRLGRVLMIENSAYPLDAFRRLAGEHNPHGKDVEFVSLDRNHIPPGLDYGYAELDQLDLGIPRSRLAASSRYFVKATGRLTFPGVSRLIDRLPRDYRYAIDTRTAIPVFGPPQRWVHCRLIVVSAAFFAEHWQGRAKHLLLPGEPVEMMMYRLFRPHRGAPGSIDRWPVHVPVRGHSGVSGTSYGTPKRRALDALRHAGRLVAPAWWI